LQEPGAQPTPGSPDPALPPAKPTRMIEARQVVEDLIASIPATEG